ncbi:hypothetical protein [Chitinophaga sp.]|uniref:hypothetical protein n=1 Tax=Chitinophaga sp. TaxID=1869181 RepID=UPI002F93F155
MEFTLGKISFEGRQDRVKSEIKWVKIVNSNKKQAFFPILQHERYDPIQQIHSIKHARCQDAKIQYTDSFVAIGPAPERAAITF